MSTLHELYLRFDAIAHEMGMSKVDTIGDAYLAMAAAREDRPEWGAARALAFAAALPAMLAAIAAFIQALRNSKATKELGHEINGRMTQLVESTREAAAARGHA